MGLKERFNEILNEETDAVANALNLLTGTIYIEALRNMGVAITNQFNKDELNALEVLVKNGKAKKWNDAGKTWYRIIS